MLRRNNKIGKVEALILGVCCRSRFLLLVERISFLSRSGLRNVDISLVGGAGEEEGQSD